MKLSEILVKIRCENNNLFDIYWKNIHPYLLLKCKNCGVGCVSHNGLYSCMPYPNNDGFCFKPNKIL